MTTIGRRINTAIEHLSEKDYENALIQISIAIDSTVKKSGQRLALVTGFVTTSRNTNHLYI